MGKEIFILCLSFVILLNGCKSSQMAMNDVTCLRQINTDISKELKKELGHKYDAIKKDVKLIMKFYIKENGQADSIVFVKSNLLELGINEELINNKLMRNSYKCIWDVYYTKKLEPHDVTIIFNPKLID